MLAAPTPRLKIAASATGLIRLPWKPVTGGPAALGKVGVPFSSASAAQLSPLCSLALRPAGRRPRPHGGPEHRVLGPRGESAGRASSGAAGRVLPPGTGADRQIQGVEVQPRPSSSSSVTWARCPPLRVQTSVPGTCRSRLCHTRPLRGSSGLNVFFGEHTLGDRAAALFWKVKDKSISFTTKNS